MLKPQQVTLAMKAVVSSSDDEVEFTKMSIDEEILQLESYLPKEYFVPTTPLQKVSLEVAMLDEPFADYLPKVYDPPAVPHLKNSLQAPTQDEASADVLQKNTYEIYNTFSKRFFTNIFRG